MKPNSERLELLQQKLNAVKQSINDLALVVDQDPNDKTSKMFTNELQCIHSDFEIHIINLLWG